MSLRNACLYTDIDRDTGVVQSPENVITSAHAYCFVCMAHEVLAEQIGERAEIIDALEAFQRRFGKRARVDDLEFPRDPDRFRDEAQRLGR